MKVATGNNVLRAYSQAVRHLQSKWGKQTLSASAVSAGFIVPQGLKKQKKGERAGVQVFVKVIRYSDAMLARFPFSGGLHENP